MYARAVTVEINPEMWGEALEFGNAIKDEVASFPGLKSWVFMANRETGHGTSFAVFESEDTFRAANDQVNQILAEFRRFFVAAPNELLGDILVHVES
jgi:hypothetical protein